MAGTWWGPAFSQPPLSLRAPLTCYLPRRMWWTGNSTPTPCPCSWHAHPQAGAQEPDKQLLSSCMSRLPPAMQVLYNDANRVLAGSNYLGDAAAFVKRWNALQAQLRSGEAAWAMLHQRCPLGCTVRGEIEFSGDFLAEFKGAAAFNLLVGCGPAECAGAESADLAGQVKEMSSAYTLMEAVVDNFKAGAAPSGSG